MQKENSSLSDDAWHLASMTGIGRSSKSNGTIAIEIIARSVNHRGLDIKCRLPHELSFLEPEIYKAVGTNFDRGRVEIDAKLLRSQSKASWISIDEEAMEILLVKLTNLQSRFQHMGLTVSMGDVMSVPGIVRVEEPPIAEIDLKDCALQAISGALVDLKKSRAHEGAILQKVLKEMNSHATELIRTIDAMANADVRQRFEKFKGRIDELTDKFGVNEDRIMQEFALLSERADFKEEIDRLIAHGEHFENICQSGNAVGRKLDFLCQEMLRETNTLMSKAFDSKVTIKAIDLKAEIERIREQVQNIE